MLKLNTKIKIPLGLSALGIGVIPLLSYLTFIPNQASAESLIVDPNEKRSLSDISTMQEMSQQICINFPENETKQLRDTRDNKSYWVTKLKDGNCWMTQNLDYNDPNSIERTTPSEWAKDNSISQFFHSETQFAANPVLDAFNPDKWTPANNDGFILATQFLGTDGQTICTKTAGSLAAPNNSLAQCKIYYYTFYSPEYKEHMSIGNYYSWEAAQKVCPSNWSLPGGGESKATGTYGGLMQANNILANSDGSAIVQGGPFYFALGGQIRDQGLQYVNTQGMYWSSTPYGSSAYYFDINKDAQLSPAGWINTVRYQAHSVRCLAPGGWLDSYPDPVEPADNQASVSITVSPVISIDVTKHADDMTVDFTSIARSSIIARVGSNQGYQVLISTEQSNLEQSPIVENQHIPMITTDQKISAGNKAWGISKDITVVSSTGTTISNPTIDTNTIYSPIGLGENKALFYTSNTPASEDLTFPVAIAVDSSLPSGQYSTQVTLTAVAM